MDTNHKELLTSTQLRQLEGGISDMSLWRRLNDPHLNFPKPMYILKRRYWDSAEYWQYRKERIDTRKNAFKQPEAA